MRPPHLPRSAMLSIGRLFLFVFLLSSVPAGASPPCTIIARADTGKALIQEGPCEVRSSPASSFKIPLALMGSDAGILTGKHSPAWLYQDAYKTWNADWKKTTDPASWLQDSVVWYSQVLVKTLGQPRFQKYVDVFSYGNRDLSGEHQTPQVLPQAVWVSSTLQISPIEQIAFLRKFVNRDLPVSSKAYELTSAIVPVFKTSDGWVVHGKTGTGFQAAKSGEINSNRQFGWFVGWADNDKGTIVFAKLIRDDGKVSSRAGFRARDSLIAALTLLGRANPDALSAPSVE